MQGLENVGHESVVVLMWLTIADSKLASLGCQVEITERAESNDGCSLITTRQVLDELLDRPVLWWQVTNSLHP